MKKIITIIFILSGAQCVNAQSINKIIKEKEVRRIEKTLAADDMEGRRTFTPGIDKASAFIESEFRKIGLQTFNGAANYRQEFYMYQSTNTSSKIVIKGNPVSDSLVASFSYEPEVSLTEKNEIEVVAIKAGEKFGSKFYEYYQSKKNLLVLVDSSFKSRLKNIQKFEKSSANPGKNTVIFVFGITEANTFSIDLTNKVTKKALNNVVGVLPGKSRPD
jgi:hypothetical protein